MSEFSTAAETPSREEAEIERVLRDGEPEAVPIQGDLFTVMSVIGDWPVKDDMASMEHPFYALSKTPEKRIREYSRGGRTLKIIPSVVGAPTIFDKDLMIYLISMVMKARNEGAAVNPRIRLHVTPFLKETRRSTGGASYVRVVEMCRRLAGVRIETNINTTEHERTKGFGLLAEFEVVQTGKNEKGALVLEVLLSEWIWRAISDFDVLTLNKAYFGITQALERRVYELARKHCGKQGWWVVGLELLREKVGSEQSARKWKQEVKAMAAKHDLPDYRIFLDESVKPNQVIILSRDRKALMEQAEKAGKVGWIEKVLQMKLH